MRTYSEREVADIIERAAERQAASREADDRPGLTLDEIERLGAEAGLDPAALRAAAAEIDEAGRTLSRQASQTRTQVVVERWLDGPLTPEGWEDAVVELQGTTGPDMSAAMGLGAAGQQKQIGRAYEWSHVNALGVQTQVLASPRGDRTRLRITQRVGLSSPTVEGVVYGGATGVLAAFAALVATASADLPGLVVLASVLVAFVLVTAVAAPATAHLDRRWRAGKLRKLDALADRLSPILVPADPAPSPQPAGPEAAGQAPLRDAFDAVATDDPAPPDALPRDPTAGRARA